MSDAQPHTMLSSSPAPTDVSHHCTTWHLNFDSAPNESFNKIFFLLLLLPGHSNRGRGRVPVSRRRWVFSFGARRTVHYVTLVKICCLWELDSLTFTLLGDPEDRMHSGGDILQDCSSEHSSLTKTESDPPGDLSLPGEKSSARSKEEISDCQEKSLNRNKMKEKEKSGIFTVYVISLCIKPYTV